MRKGKQESLAYINISSMEAESREYMNLNVFPKYFLQEINGPLEMNVDTVDHDP